MPSGFCLHWTCVSMCWFCWFVGLDWFGKLYWPCQPGYPLYLQNWWFCTWCSLHSNVYTPILAYTKLTELIWMTEDVVLSNSLDPTLDHAKWTCHIYLCRVDLFACCSWIQSFRHFLVTTYLTYQHIWRKIVTYLMFWYLRVNISNKIQIRSRKANFETEIQSIFKL